MWILFSRHLCRDGKFDSLILIDPNRKPDLAALYVALTYMDIDWIAEDRGSAMDLLRDVFRGCRLLRVEMVPLPSDIAKEVRELLDKASSGIINRRKAVELGSRIHELVSRNLNLRVLYRN